MEARPAPSAGANPAHTMGDYQDDRVPDAAAIDMQVIDGLRELGGDDEPGLLLEVVGLFLEDGPRRLVDIERALEQGDLRSLERAAHTLKSSSLNVGATVLAQLCREIELHARKQELAPVRGLCDAGKEHWPSVERALRSIG